MTLPTPEQTNNLCAIFQSTAATDETACRAADVPLALYRKWMEAADQPGANAAIRALKTAIDKAKALFDLTILKAQAAHAATDPGTVQRILSRKPRFTAPGSLGTPLKDPRREKFAQLVATGMTYDEAYKQADPTGRGHKNARKYGSRLMTNADIIYRVTELQHISGTEAVLTVARRREIATEIATNENVDPAVRLKATEVEAKHAGEYLEKTDVTTNGEALPSIVPTFTLVVQSHWKESRT